MGDFIVMTDKKEYRMYIESIAVIFGLALLNHHFPALAEVKITYAALWRIPNLPLYIPFHHRCNVGCLSLLYHHSHGKCSCVFRSIVPISFLTYYFGKKYVLFRKVLTRNSYFVQQMPTSMRPLII